MRFCVYCGAALGEDTMFCHSCGAKVITDIQSSDHVNEVPGQNNVQSVNDKTVAEYPEDSGDPFLSDPLTDSQNQQPNFQKDTEGYSSGRSRGRKALNIIIPVASFLVVLGMLVLVFIMIFFPFVHDSSPKITIDEIQFLNVNNDSYIINSKGDVTLLENKLIYEFTPSGTGDKAIFSTGKSGESQVGPLDFCYYDGKNVYTILKDVDFTYLSQGYRIISYNGSAVYFLDPEEEDHAKTICVFSGGKTTRLDVKAKLLSVVSPDGKTVAYIRDKGDDRYGYFYTGGTEYSIGKNRSCIGIADNAGYVYFVLTESSGLYSYTQKLYVQKGADEDSRIRLSDNIPYSIYLFSSDFSQLLFYSGDEKKTYLSVDGNESVRLSSKVFFPVYIVDYLAKSSVVVATYPGSFDNLICLYIDPNGTVNFARINKNQELEISDVDIDISVLYKIIPNSDFSKMVYLNDDMIYLYDLGHFEDEPSVVVRNSVDKILYFTDNDTVVYSTDNEVFAQKIGDKKVKVLDDMNEVESFKVFRNRGFMVMEDRLFCFDGNETKLVKEMYDVIRLSGGEKIMIVETEDAFYYTTNGKNFRFLADK